MDGDLEKVALHIVDCARSWDPNERLLGNARADDIATLYAHYLSLRYEVKRLQDTIERLWGR